MSQARPDGPTGSTDLSLAPDGPADVSIELTRTIGAWSVELVADGERWTLEVEPEDGAVITAYREGRYVDDRPAWVKTALEVARVELEAE